MNANKKRSAFALFTPGALALAAWVLVPSASATGSQEYARYRHLAERMTNQSLSAIVLEGDACDRSTNIALRASVRGALRDFDLALAVCVNLTDPDEISDCLQDALDQLAEDLELVDDQLVARESLCTLLGGGPYAPDLDPANFIQGTTNPYLAFFPGNTWTYQAEVEEGLEEIFIQLTGNIVNIEGINCIEVRDTVTLDGELVEDTFDWYAEDLAGNVWYMGELSMNYEDGRLENLDGSWVTGVDGALPGIAMPANPVAGTTHRLEWLLTEAEDAATVIDTNATATIGFGGTYTGCIETFDFTPVDPTSLESKFYARDIGFILETKPSGERLELVAFP